MQILDYLVRVISCLHFISMLYFMLLIKFSSVDILILKLRTIRHGYLWIEIFQKLHAIAVTKSLNQIRCLFFIYSDPSTFFQQKNVENRSKLQKKSYSKNCEFQHKWIILKRSNISSNSWEFSNLTIIAINSQWK